MSKQKKIFSILGGGTVCLALAFSLYLWMADRPIRTAMALQNQLITATDLPAAARNDLKLQLMRTVDEMDRDKVRELYDELRVRQRQTQQADIEAYHAAAEDEKVAILDRSLDRMASAREVYAALRTDGLRGRGRRSRGDQRNRSGDRPTTQRDNNKSSANDAQRREDADRSAARQTATGRGDRNRGDNRAADRGRRGDRDRQRGRGQRDDDRAPLTAEERERRDAYYQALKERAEQRGIEAGGRRDRDRR